MEVTYIKHSGFGVRLERSALLFDYWQGEIPQFPKDFSVYVFVSHKHKDHFNLQIFDLLSEYSHIHFFLSKDTRMNAKYMERKGIPAAAADKITYVSRHECLDYNEEGMEPVRVETLDSTDSGVAYAVRIEDRQLYHGGDLNWWSWEEESGEEEQAMAEKYTREITRLAGRRFDAVFLPLDGRQGDRFWYGLDYFMKTADAAAVFPMHCFEDYSVIGKLAKMELSKLYRSKLVPICEPGEVYEVR